MKVHLVLGPPASGKGSLAKLIAKKYALTHLSTGAILRDSVFEGTEEGLMAKACMDKGILVDDDMVNGIVFARLRSETSDVLFDGYPRTLGQAKALDGFLFGAGLSYGSVVFIDVPDSVLESRMLGRLVCSECGAIYHESRHRPAMEGACDNCRGRLVQRGDDAASAFQTRMDVYHTLYVPVLAHYRGGPNFRQVDGSGLPLEVFGQVSKLYEKCGECA
jgi:adenylate kinase